LPFVLALLLSYLLRPIARALGRVRIRAPFAAAIILLSLVGTIGCAISFLAPPAAGWLEKAPYSLHKIQKELMPLKQPVESVARASGEIEKLAAPTDVETKTAVEVKRHPLTDMLYVQTPELIVSTVMLLILLYFLLAFDGVFLPKLIKLLPTLSDKANRRSSRLQPLRSRSLNQYPAGINRCLARNHPANTKPARSRKLHERRWSR
jgi:predicted PurR-regulated permease PerM